MKANYEAWSIKTDDFYALKSESEKLNFLLKFAVLAPSSHNTQPWAFLVTDNTINVYREIDRSLPVADINDRQLFLSIGCAVENIVIAAEFYGYKCEIEKINSDINPDFCVKIKLNYSNHIQKKLDFQIQSLIKRKTNRGKFRNEKISENLKQDIKGFEKSNVQIHIIDNATTIEKLGNIAISSSIDSMINSNFRKELSHHLKHNLTGSKYGMPGFTLGVPTLPSFILPKLMRHLNLEKASQKQNKILFEKHTPHVVVIATNSDLRNDWLEAGRIFERIAIVCEKEKISLSPWGAPIEIGIYYKKIQELLETGFRPQLFFRMGYSLKDVKHSPRFSSEEVLKKII